MKVAFGCDDDDFFVKGCRSEFRRKKVYFGLYFGLAAKGSCV